MTVYLKLQNNKFCIKSSSVGNTVYTPKSRRWYTYQTILKENVRKNSNVKTATD